MIRDQTWELIKQEADPFAKREQVILTKNGTQSHQADIVARVKGKEIVFDNAVVHTVPTQLTAAKPGAMIARKEAEKKRIYGIHNLVPLVAETRGRIGQKYRNAIARITLAAEDREEVLKNFYQAISVTIQRANFCLIGDLGEDDDDMNEDKRGDANQQEGEGDEETGEG